MRCQGLKMVNEHRLSHPLNSTDSSTNLEAFAGKVPAGEKIHIVICKQFAVWHRLANWITTRKIGGQYITVSVSKTRVVKSLISTLVDLVPRLLKKLSEGT